MDLALLWFLIVGFMFVGYFILDGFDFGVGMSLPFLGKDNVDRRVLINTIGPVWDLNETWLIVAGASLFAAFPEWYATLFSGFYLPLLLILLALIARGVSFEYRHQGKGEKWTKWFDWMIVIGSAVPALLWGVAFANLIQGVPMIVDDYGHHIYTGGLFYLLNPYGLLGGLTTLMLFFTHGVIFVSLKTVGEIKTRAEKLAKQAGIITVLVAASFLIWTVIQHLNAPHLWLIIVLALVAALALVGGLAANWFGRNGLAFTGLAITIAAAVGTILAALFPNVISGVDGLNSLGIWDAKSSDYTLTVMSWTALVMLPLILFYQGWTYKVFSKRISRKNIPAESVETAH